MRLLSCLHPKVITNPYTGEKLQVRCGKCEACRNAQSANWVQRLHQEISDNKYTVFVTLQYDELHVPQMVRLRKEDAPSPASYIDVTTGEIISLTDDCISSKSKKDFDYCYNTKVLRVHNNIDFPKFMKRLRYYNYELHKNSTDRGGSLPSNLQLAKLRYYAVAEYGNTTYRPHYHLLLFSNSSLFSQNFEVLLNKAWQYGRVYDPHIIDSCGAANYVASYLNCSANLPSIYLHKSIRQRHFFSKSPAIGTLSFTLEEAKEIVISQSLTKTLFDSTSNKFCDVPLWRSIQFRCFPRIQRFDCLNHDLRVELYRLSERPVFDRSTFEVAQWLEYYYVRRRNCKSEIHEYFRCISRNPTPLIKTSVSQCGTRFNFNSLVSFVRVVKRALHMSVLLGIKLEDYVNYIELYYEKLQKSQLKDYFVAQSQYFENGNSLKDYILANPYFIESVNGKDVDSLNDSQLFYLKYYGVIDDSYKGVVYLTYEDSFEYQNLYGQHKKIFFENTKSKCRNDYLFQHSREFANIINYKSS